MITEMTYHHKILKKVGRCLGKDELDSEQGSQVLEFIILLPMIFMVFLIGWQFLLAGHTFIVTANAAREGARALAVCNASFVEAYDAANDSVADVFDAIVIPIDGDDKVSVTVTTKIPAIKVFRGNVDVFLPPVPFTVEMRKERCP